MESQEKKKGYWKAMCSTLEAENQNLRVKIKFVVRLIKKKNKKLKRFDKEMEQDQDKQGGQSSSLKANCGGGGRKKIMEKSESSGSSNLPSSLRPPPKQAFQILHEELWAMILDEYVKDPDDILTMCRVSSQLNGIYYDTKWRLAFDKVFPSLLRHLNQRDLLNLRLSCKKWKVIIDSMLESHISSFTLCHNTDISKFEPVPLFQYPQWRREQGPTQILGIPQITQFLQEMEDRRSRLAGEPNGLTLLQEDNPFIGRAVHFSPRPPDFDENATIQGAVVSEYWQLLLELLTHYGKHINQLFLSTGNAEMQSLIFYRHLRVCLDLVPNLQVLKLEGSLRQPRNTYCELRLRIFRETHKLPELVHLKCLDINSRLELWVDRVDGVRSYHEEKHVVLNQLVLQTYSQQVETLYYRGKPINPNSVTEYPQQLPNVKELNALCSDSVGVMFLLREVRMPELTTLRVYVPQGCYVLRELFLLLQRSPLLSRLELGETQLLLTDDLPQLEPAPQVTYLYVGHSVHVSYNYLVCLPNLKYLGICVSPMTPEQEYIDSRENHNEVVKIRNYLRGKDGKDAASLYHSNVWKLLPKLEILDVFKNGDGNFWKRFTRKGYDWHVEINKNNN